MDEVPKRCGIFSAAQWFLSPSGNNSLSCGNKINTSCETLNWLLRRFYNTSYMWNETLVLVTNSSLILNDKSTVSMDSSDIRWYRFLFSIQKGNNILLYSCNNMNVIFDQISGNVVFCR